MRLLLLFVTVLVYSGFPKNPYPWPSLFGFGQARVPLQALVLSPVEQEGWQSALRPVPFASPSHIFKTEGSSSSWKPTVNGQGVWFLKEVNCV